MSDYSVIADVGQTLKELLWENIKVDNKIHPDIIASEGEITLSLPGETQGTSTTKLSLYLYRITENPFLKNQEIQNNDPGKIKYTPLGIDLFYLLTAECGNCKMDHTLLGKVIQVFHDNPVVRGSILKGDSLGGSSEQLRLLFYPLPFEEILQLWQSFSEKSFKLSICYQVTPIKIDSTREIEAKRVAQKEDQSYQKSEGE